MIKIFQTQFVEPLKSIKDNKFHFIAWLIVAIGFGLCGLWVRLLVLSIEEPASLTSQNLIRVGILAPFVIIILADGIASMLGSVNAGSNQTAAGIRKVIGSIALIIVIIQVIVFSIIQYKMITQDNVYTPVVLQVIITFFAILIAIYLYCFRFQDWEKDVGEVYTEETEEVDGLGGKALSQKNDGKGVKL